MRGIKALHLGQAFGIHKCIIGEKILVFMIAQIPQITCNLSSEYLNFLTVAMHYDVVICIVH